MPERVFWFFEFFLIFFSEFSCPVEYERNSGLKFFSLFLHLSHPILAKNNSGKGFLNFFAMFFGISFHGSSMNGIQVYNFFLSFSAYLIPLWLKIMPERGFLIFFNFFLYFFPNFLARVEYERNSGLKFFSLFLGLSHPILAKKNAEKGFLKFFSIFLGIFLPASSVNGIWVEIFFVSFSTYLIPFWLKIIPERVF